MQLRFQYNKTEIQRLGRELDMRAQALPTLKSKETALRLEMQKARQRREDLEAELADAYTTAEDTMGFFRSLPELLDRPQVRIRTQNIAGVKFRVLEEITFPLRPLMWFDQPPWATFALDTLQQLIRLRYEIGLLAEEIEILGEARKKTTQKVNLYERVQMPAYRDAIRKIKRFLEDEENLNKAAQKLVKKRKEREEEAV